MKNTKRAICYIFAIFLALQSFCNTQLTAHADDIPLPDTNWNIANLAYNYNDSTKTLTQSFLYRPSAGAAQQTKSYTYNNPARASWEVLHESHGIELPSIEGGGYVLFHYTANTNIFLAVSLTNKKVQGYYVRPEGETHYEQLYSQQVQGSNSLTVWFKNDSTQQAVEISNLPPTLALMIAGTTEIAFNPRSGFAKLEVTGLVPATEITSEPVLCADVKADFTGSAFFDKLPNKEAILAKITAGTWPSELSNFAKFYLEYNIGGIWTRASFSNSGSFNVGTGDYVKKPNNEGKVEFKLKRGNHFPIGKYKITGILYIKNETGGTGPSRLDAPGQGGWVDWMYGLKDPDNSLEIFQTETFEVDLTTATPTTAEGIKPTCKQLTFKSRGTFDPENRVGKDGDGKTVCDKLGGIFIVAMLKTAFCGLMLITKEWADTAYNYSLGLLEDSIGVATDDQVPVEPGTRAEGVDVGPNKLSDEAVGENSTPNTNNAVTNSGNCAMNSGAVQLQSGSVTLPKEGKIVKEAHLVTSNHTAFSSSWPSSATDKIQEHFTLTQTAIGRTYAHTGGWTPAEGGHVGQGSASKPPANLEPWVMNMYWTASSKPPEGKRVIIKAGTKTVVAAAGYETGPSTTYLLGAQEEVLQELGVQTGGNVTVGFATDQSLPYGPINCTATP